MITLVGECLASNSLFVHRLTKVVALVGQL